MSIKYRIFLILIKILYFRKFLREVVRLVNFRYRILKENDSENGNITKFYLKYASKVKIAEFTFSVLSEQKGKHIPSTKFCLWVKYSPINNTNKTSIDNTE